VTGHRILVVDDDPLVLSYLCRSLSAQGLDVATATTGGEALDKVREIVPDVILADVRLPNVDGITLLQRCMRTRAAIPVIMFTGHGTIEDAVHCMRLGATDYLTKPIDQKQLRLAILRALEIRRVYRENEQLRKQAGGAGLLPGLVAKDYQMRKILDTVLQIADSDATVLITGESGTGKTMIARSIHSASLRRNGPFVEVNCAALPDTLLASELFGHVRGAFTSAVSHRMGKFEAAHGGSIFLDEISNASPSLQMKLLRTVQYNRFERVGDNKTIKVDCRLIAATNKSLEEEVTSGRFRDDLYHRLNVINVRLPLLRDRIADIPLLSLSFLKEFSRQHGKNVEKIDRPVMQRLVRYTWPGNVRELRNVIEHGVILCRDSAIGLEHMPVQISGITLTQRKARRVKPLRQALQDPERACIRRALRLSDGNKQLAAKALHISRSTLYNKIRELGLEAVL